MNKLQKLGSFIIPAGLSFAICYQEPKHYYHRSTEVKSLGLKIAEMGSCFQGIREIGNAYINHFQLKDATQTKFHLKTALAFTILTASCRFIYDIVIPYMERP